MFKMRFEKLCAERNISPAAVCKAIGLSNSIYSKWNENSLPRNGTLRKISEYFDVSIEYLTGETDSPNITLKDRLFPEDTYSLQEKELIDLFRDSSPSIQFEVITILKNHIKEKTNSTKKASGK